MLGGPRALNPARPRMVSQVQGEVFRYTQVFGLAPPNGVTLHPVQIESRGGVVTLRSASVLGCVSAVPVMLRHVPTCCEAHGDGETALLRLVEALVQRLLGVGQTA